MESATSRACLRLGWALFGAFTAGLAAAQPPAAIVTYEASYGVHYKGRAVGRADFRVDYDSAARVYRFHSRTQATGLLRVIVPRPVVETSEFTVVGGEIRPLHFAFEDGSRRGADNFVLHFDWGAQSVRTEQDGEIVEMPLPPGSLDRATLQVALMRDMRDGLREREYPLVDEDSLRRYTVRSDGSEPVETPLGTFATERYVQTRPGSSRRTVIWAAPALEFLPVRIEQQRDGEPQTTLLLESYADLDPPFHRE